MAVALLGAAAQAAPAGMSGENTEVRGAALNGGGAVGMRSVEAGSSLGDMSGTIDSNPTGVFRKGDGSVAVLSGPWPVFSSEGDLTPAATATARASTTPGGATPTGPARTATPVPTVTPGGNPTGTPPGNTPFPDFYPRGDADCNVRISAADIVRHLVGEAESDCDNLDCNRDGAVTEADADCAARCVFGDCPILPGAPQVATITPESAQEIVALSLIRIAGRDLSSDALLQVKIGGQSAQIVEATEEEIVVAVPPRDPGLVDLVVVDGERASHRVPLRIEESAPSGNSDGLADLLDVFDDAGARFAGLDLATVYDDESVALIRELTSVVREEGRRFRNEGLEPLDPEIREVLDRVLDGARVVETLRATLGQLDASGGGAGLPATVNFTRRVVTEIYVATAELTQAYSAAKLELFAEISAAARTAQRLRTLLSAAAAALRLTVAVAGWAAVIDLAPDVLADATAPIPVGFVFRDQDGNQRDYPTAGGTMRMRGCRIGLETTGLELKLPNVPQSVPLDPIGRCADDARLDLCPPRPIPPFRNGCLEYQLPDTIGFCGMVGFTVFNELAGARFQIREVGFNVQPELVAASVNAPQAVHRIDLQVRGVAPCNDVLEIELEGPDPTTRRRLIGIGGSGQFLKSKDPQTYEATSYTRKPPEEEDRCSLLIPPAGVYIPRLEVDGVEAEEVHEIELSELTRHLQFSCDDDVLALSSDSFPRFTNCRLRPQGVSRVGERFLQACFPLETREAILEIVPTDILVPKIGSVVVRPRGDPEFRFKNRIESFDVTLEAVQPGSAAIDGSVFLEGGFFLAETERAYDIEVRDDSDPSITVVPCGGVAVAGEVLRIDVEVFDDFVVNKLFVSAPENVTNSAEQELSCILNQTIGCPPFVDCCRNSFDIPILDDAPSGNFDVTVRATDAVGNQRTTVCNFTIPSGDVVGTVRNEVDGSPLAGATVYVLDPQRNRLAETTSANDGSFMFTEVAGNIRFVVARLEGFQTAEREVFPDTEIVIGLARIVGDTLTVRGRLRISGVVDPQGTLFTPADGATVTIFDRRLSVVGIGVTDSEGEFEIAGVPRDEYIVRMTKPGFAAVSSHRSVSGAIVARATYPVNTSCTSDSANFDVTRGTTTTGHGVNFFGNATFETVNQNFLDPTAALLCISGDTARPTFDWNPAALAEFNQFPRSIDVREFVSVSRPGPRIFFLFNPTGNPLDPPILYGDPSEGTIEPPFETPVRGTEYTLTTYNDTDGELDRAYLSFRARQ